MMRLVSSTGVARASGTLLRRDADELPIALKQQKIADLLTRQQEEYEEYPIDERAGETLSTYRLRLRSAYQAALSVTSSRKDDRSYGPAMWIALAVAFSILLFLKLKFG